MAHLNATDRAELKDRILLGLLETGLYVREEGGTWYGELLGVLELPPSFESRDELQEIALAAAKNALYDCTVRIAVRSVTSEGTFVGWTITWDVQ